MNKEIKKALAWLKEFEDDFYFEYTGTNEHSETIRKALEAQQGWQDISTAPKDGTRILIAKGENIGHAYYRGLGFCVVASNDMIRDSDITHWQPLPPPPKADRENT